MTQLSKPRSYTRFEQVMAWGSMFVLIGATVAVSWIAAGVVYGLIVLVLFAGATGYMAATGQLIRKEDK